MKIRIDGKYMIRDGRRVRILCVDAYGKWPVVFQIVGLPEVYVASLEGKSSVSTRLDLRPYNMTVTTNGKYKTRDGRRVRILCTNANGNWPVLVNIGESTEIHSYRLDGTFDLSPAIEHSTDLIEVDE